MKNNKFILQFVKYLTLLPEFDENDCEFRYNTNFIVSSPIPKKFCKTFQSL